MIFPNITIFEVSIHAERAYSMLFSLIVLLSSSWSSRLVTLKIYIHAHGCQYIYGHMAHHWSLLNVINQRNLPVLKNLTFCITGKLIVGNLDERYIDLPIISQLERFHFATGDQPDLIEHSLLRYGGPNRALKQIAFKYLPRSLNCSIVDKLNSQALTSRMTTLLSSISVDDLENNSSQRLREIFAKFPNQQTQMTFSSDNMSRDGYSHAELITNLAMLKHLPSLRLCFETYVDVYTQLLDRTLPRLTSIRMLSIGGLYTHQILSQLCIDWGFPNLQVLVIQFGFSPDHLGTNCHLTCHLCIGKKLQSEGTLVIRKCIREHLRPLKKCAKIRKVIVSNNITCDISDIIEEFSKKCKNSSNTDGLISDMKQLAFSEST